MSNGSSVDRLAEVLRVQAGAGTPGQALPSTRALMAEHRVGPGTVGAAVARLVGQGVLVTAVGRGTFIAARHRVVAADLGWQAVALGEARVDAREVAALVTPPPPGAVALSAGYPSPELQPLAALAAAATRAARRPRG